VRFPRASGVLLHPTSLPGRFGIGGLGREARAFVEFLADAGQAVWQVLPLGPTGYGDSPYQCFSAFAGNPLLACLETLADEGLLEHAELEAAPAFPNHRVDYGAVIPWKRGVLERAAARFGDHAPAEAREEFRAWCARHAGWLEDFALFMALKDAHGGAAWCDWPAPLRRREPAALESARGEHARAVHAHRFAQWVFFRQWGALRAHANARNIAIFGDAPIFVAYDSADVWSRPDLFHLDDAGRPTVVAGVPPDYFSETGQLWGNPLYRWDALAAEGHAWWIARVRAQFEMVDRLRLDHFIGFTRCWEVPAGAADARTGRFTPGPGAALFQALEEALGDLPIVAEDLGVVTPEVEALRDRFAFPGMKILQFAFGGATDSSFLPHAYTRNCVAYTGTHDNDTTLGWWRTCAEHERDLLRRYLDRDVTDPAWALIRLGMASVADTFVAPAQDLLALPGEARMNFPGRAADNWGWRLAEGALDPALGERLRILTELYGRRSS
jgi:4-alpha-glucanotransferase